MLCDCGPNKLAEYCTSLLNYNKLYKNGCRCIYLFDVTILETTGYIYKCSFAKESGLSEAYSSQKV